MVTPLFKKLNLGNQTRIHVLQAPDSFEPALAALPAVQVARRVTGSVEFALAFVITQAELDTLSQKLIQATTGDATLWFVYPKQSSKKYRCEFHRDSGWHVLGAAGFEPVRMVAIDEDWSALRFRRTEYVKNMTRNPAGAISAAGKKKARATRQSAQSAKPATPSPASAKRRKRKSAG
ncbi:MAG: hypothetical protein JSS02_22415 [Planctomycetes bacterium]|nr:hypothetical protein [Planctomycetota bacterium]